MNLAICLLMARRFLLKKEIRQVLEQYRLLDSEQAFEKMFERDKEELRQMGLPVETGSNDPWNQNEIGYRILRGDFELPPIDFDAAELAVLGVAAQVWDAATQADQTKLALAKLRAAGADPDPGRLAALTPSLDGKEAAFDAMWQAVIARIPVEFGYHEKTRQLQPWSITHRHGAWYVYGLDMEKQQGRVYKLSRVETDVKYIGKPGSYFPETPEKTNLLTLIQPAMADQEAILAIDGDEIPMLRRRGEVVETDSELPPGYTAYRIDYSSDVTFAAEICAHGAAVIVLEPESLRNAVITHLQKFLEVE